MDTIDDTLTAVHIIQHGTYHTAHTIAYRTSYSTPHDVQHTTRPRSVLINA